MINKYALTTFVSELSKSIPTGRILLNEPMSEHTTFAVGGPADVLVLPESVKEMSLAIRAARRLDLVVTVLGGGVQRPCPRRRHPRCRHSAAVLEKDLGLP